MRIPKMLVIPVVAVTLLLGACSSPTTGGSTPNPNVPQTIVYGSFRDFTRGSLDPAVAAPIAGADGPLLAAVYGYLVSSDATTGAPIYEMAESLKSSPDFLTWTLKLRSGLVFSDGTPLNADAVKFNFDRHGAATGQSYNRANMTGVTTAVVDPLTVAVTLPRPNANFDKIISGGVGFIASPTALQADPKGFGVAPVGAGPFIVKSVVRDSVTKLEKNPKYYLADKVALTNIEVRVIPDPTQLMNSLIAGEIDIMSAGSARVNETAKAGGMEVLDHVVNGQSSGYYVNAITGPFADLRARQALAYALDIDALSQITSGEDSAQELFAPDSPYYVKGVHPATNNHDKAQALFDQLAAEGKPLSFRMMGYDFAPPTTLEAIQSQLKAYKNVSATIQLVSSQAFVTAVNQTKNYDLALSGLPFADPEPILYDLFHTKGFQNKTGYSDPQLDALLEKARLSSDVSVKTPIYAQVQDILAAAVLWVKFAPSRAGWAHSASVDNVDVSVDGIVRFDKITRG